MKNFLLRLIPFVLSILCGISLFFISVYSVENDDLSSLINGISASLLAIPIIFLVYNYVDYKMSKKVNISLANSLGYEINAFMLRLIMTLRGVLGIKEKLSWKSIERMMNLEAHQIKKHIKISAGDLKVLKSDKIDLDDLVYKAAKTGVLGGVQVQTLAELVNELSRLINERKFRGKIESLANSLEKVLALMDDWFDSYERTELQAHHHFQLAMEEDVGTRQVK